MNDAHTHANQNEAGNGCSRITNVAKCFVLKCHPSVFASGGDGG